MDTLEGLLQGIVAEPAAEDRWLVVADWLEEHDDPRRAELLRLHRRLLATCCEPAAHPERAEQQARIVRLLAEGVAPCVPRLTVAVGRVEMDFVFVPPGDFLMGSPPDEPGRWEGETLHRVTLTAGYWLGVTAVTGAQWNALREGPRGRARSTDRPVEGLNWGACQRYCARLGERLSRACVLPTAAQWEHACRAGTSTLYFVGDSITPDQADIAPLQGPISTKGPPGRVGRFPPNAWGLHDMHGGVWEWCADWFEPHDRHPAIDPQGPAVGRDRVIRGGCWFLGSRFCRSANHAWDASGERQPGRGFRVCLPSP
jgi:uncharacterized protein (TIGR02996 family)